MKIFSKIAAVLAVSLVALVLAGAPANAAVRSGWCSGSTTDPIAAAYNRADAYSYRVYDMSAGPVGFVSSTRKATVRFYSPSSVLRSTRVLYSSGYASYGGDHYVPRGSSVKVTIHLDNWGPDYSCTGYIVPR